MVFVDVPPLRLGRAAVGSANLAAGAVTAGKLGARAVGTHEQGTITLQRSFGTVENLSIGSWTGAFGSLNTLAGRRIRGRTLYLTGSMGAGTVPASRIGAGTFLSRSATGGAFGSYGSIAATGPVRARYGSFSGTVSAPHVHGGYGSFRTFGGSIRATLVNHGTLAEAQIPHAFTTQFGSVAGIRSVGSIQGRTLVKGGYGSFTRFGGSVRTGLVYGTWLASKLPRQLTGFGTIAGAGPGSFGRLQVAGQSSTGSRAAQFTVTPRKAFAEVHTDSVNFNFGQVIANLSSVAAGVAGAQQGFGGFAGPLGSRPSVFASVAGYKQGSDTGQTTGYMPFLVNQGGGPGAIVEAGRFTGSGRLGIGTKGARSLLDVAGGVRIGSLMGGTVPATRITQGTLAEAQIPHAFTTQFGSVAGIRSIGTVIGRAASYGSFGTFTATTVRGVRAKFTTSLQIDAGVFIAARTGSYPGTLSTGRAARAIFGTFGGTLASAGPVRGRYGSFAQYGGSARTSIIYGSYAASKIGNGTLARARMMQIVGSRIIGSIAANNEVLRYCVWPTAFPDATYAWWAQYQSDVDNAAGGLFVYGLTKTAGSIRYAIAAPSMTVTARIGSVTFFATR